MQITEVTATGTVKSTKTKVRLYILTPVGAITTAVIRDGGAGGTVRMSLQAAANGQSVVVSVPDGQPFGTDVHATLAGAGGLLYVGY